MSDICYLERAKRARLAYRYTAPSGSAARQGEPTLVFLAGYMSDMAGGKATAIFDHCQARGQGCLLLDYSGCGLSEGSFAEQTLSEWRDDVLDLIEHLLSGALVIIGSSMGGWLMLIVALALQKKRTDSASHIAGLVGIAAAPDFTEWGIADDDKAMILTEGKIIREIESFDQPYIMTRGFIESGDTHRQLDKPIELSCPICLLHGQRDDAVPFDISLRIAQLVASDDVQVTLLKDGDHRLSRDKDIALLLRVVESLSNQIAQADSAATEDNAN